MEKLEQYTSNNYQFYQTQEWQRPQVFKHLFNCEASFNEAKILLEPYYRFIAKEVFFDRKLSLKYLVKKDPKIT